jgi:hypothetical protein
VPRETFVVAVGVLGVAVALLLVGICTMWRRLQQGALPSGHAQHKEAVDDSGEDALFLGQSADQAQSEGDPAPYRRLTAEEGGGV